MIPVGPSTRSEPGSGHTRSGIARRVILATMVGTAAFCASLVLGHAMVEVPVGAEVQEAGTTGRATPQGGTAVSDSLERALARRRDPGVYVVIDRANNRLWLRTAREVRLQATVSTGSGTVLRESGGQRRTWTFDTPPGRHRVLAKRRDPVWVKPDWAFLEEGLAPPTRTSERVERGYLGEWALDLGDGYMIHGTLYERLLGRSLTHGCIRVGRDDLRVVAAAARPGTPVYIF